MLSQRGNHYSPFFPLPVLLYLTKYKPTDNAQRTQGDPYQPNWQETFYGANYKRLRSIKAKYDPHDIFYATTAVGSDEWQVEEPGVLCRVSS